MSVVDVLDPRACTLGEGPMWDDRTGEVVWVDILERRIHALELASGRTRSVETPSPVGAVLPRRAAAGWLVALESGPALLDADGVTEPLGTFAEADGAQPQHPTRANDAKCDPWGRCWLGTMTYDQVPGAAALYRLEAGARAPVRVLGDVTIGNGLGWSPDGRTMYFIDTTTQCVDAFDYAGEVGSLSNRRAVVDVPAEAGWPDGMAVDADGCLWVALWGGAAVRRYLPDGRLDRTIELPTPQTTSCAFVGPALDRLVVTSAAFELARPDELAGATFVLDVGVAGLPTNAFAA